MRAGTDRPADHSAPTLSLSLSPERFLDEVTEPAKALGTVPALF
ncbi:hypothetical protein ACFCZT_34940 [Streptomyces sp. NPDC056230]